MGELKISEDSVGELRRNKLNRRGAFKDGRMLVRTAISSPLGAHNQNNIVPLPEHDQGASKTLTRAIELPSTSTEDIHVDLRHDASGLAERQLTTAIPSHATGFSPPSIKFNLETQDGHSHEIIAEVHLDREGADIRVRLRLINAPQQLDLHLDNS